MIKHDKLMDVFEYIRRYNDENGYPPSVRDICSALNIKSTATVYDYINRLREQGYLEKSEKKNRSVIVRGSSSVRVPLLGVVNAGQPILAVEDNQGYYTLPEAEFKGDDLFLLRVHGESMIEAGIYDGDKIIVRRRPTAENGEIVVAMYDDGAGDGATVKRFFRRDGKIILHPENNTMDDIIPENQESIQILGKVIGLMRSFR